MLTLILIPFLLAMFLAINMGASGTAPAFAPAYGAGLVKRNQIALSFGLMVLLGAIFSGKQVSMTMGQGILPQEFFSLAVTSAILLSISLSLLIANLMGIPQSTTQSSVLSISGAAVFLDHLNTQKLFYEIIPTWFILPAAAFVIVLLVGKIFMPILKISPFYNSLKKTGQVTFFKPFVWASCLYVAYSIGASNVGNAAGPVTSMAILEMGITAQSDSFLVIMVLSVLIVAPCFAVGSELLGYRGLRNTGKEIVEISPLAGAMISVVTATLLLGASVTKGIPTSLVQLNAAAFMAHGVNKIGWRKTFSNPQVKRFFVMWAVAPAVAFLLAYGFLWLLRAVGLI